MEPYREGTLLKDCLGDLWMITKISKKGSRTHSFSYDLVRLRDAWTTARGGLPILNTLKFSRSRNETLSRRHLAERLSR